MFKIQCNGGGRKIEKFSLEMGEGYSKYSKSSGCGQNYPAIVNHQMSTRFHSQNGTKYLMGYSSHQPGYEGKARL